MNPDYRESYYRNRSLHQHVGDVLWYQNNYMYNGCSVEESRAEILQSFSYRYWPMDKVSEFLTDNWNMWIQSYRIW